ncbi:MAG: enoyl-ACP reductase [Gammaproteobacteria bacterium]
MGFLQGKRALITGLISNRSIAYGIAEAMHREGAELAFTYQNDRFKQRVSDMAAQWNSNLVMPCDVAKDEEITAVFSELSKHWSQLDILVHAIAFAPAELLEGDYVEHIHREGFNLAHEISSYSLVALAKAALPMMRESNGSIITLSYLGAERALPNYNVMGLAKASLEANVRYMAQSLGPKGIRVNGISAGPIRTLAASGIKNFRQMLDHNAKIAPLRQNVTQEQVGNTAAFLGSTLASGITGEIIHVDAGFHAIALSELGE